MDSAVQVVNRASAIQVTAQEINDRFHGDIPESVRFYCPFCTRPVSAGAMGYDFDRMRRTIKPGKRKTKEPYFTHRKNDEWSRYCEAYHASAGTSREEMSLPLLMFLRKELDSTQFRVEIALRRRGLALMLRELSSDEAITVDGQSYGLRDMLANRHSTIPLPNPLYQAETRIQIPQRWQINIGHVPKSIGIMIFSDAFGSNGGRRLSDHSALHTDCTYYIVAKSDRVRDARPLFSRMDRVGSISGNAKLHVYAASISGSSLAKNDIDDWLSQYGYCLSDVDRSAQLMWPPSLGSWGVDEPLFRISSPIYRFPYQISDQPMQDKALRKYFITADSNARDVGLIGFGNRFEGESESESYCVFFKPKPRMPWSTVYLGPNYPDDLHPYDEWAQTIPENNSSKDKAKSLPTNTESSPTPTDNCVTQIPLTHNAGIVFRRMGISQQQSISRSTTIAQLRERTR